jgi:hypothetical protein
MTGNYFSMDRMSFMKPWLRQILAVLLLGAMLVLLFRLSPLFMQPKIVEYDDFVEYWAAGRLNLSGANPYDPEQLRPVQLQTGRTFQVPVMMWNPPWTLPFVMPFGALDYPFSRFLWFFGQTALLIFCASFIWRFYRGSAKYRWVAWLLAFAFLPTLFVLKTGQIPAAMLLGGVLLLMFSQKPTWWLAGLAVLFITIKPHTLYLVELSFFFWIISRRRWDILAGSGVGILLATAISSLFNPLLVKQYIYAIIHYPPSSWATPTIGGGLRYVLGVDKVWLQFAPSVLGVAWFCFYWAKERLAWKWSEQMPLLVAVSVLTSSYGWSCDYIVMLLIILPVAAGIMQRGFGAGPLLVLSLYLVIDVASMAANIKGIVPDDFWFMWLAPALVGWYFLAARLGVVSLRP